MKRQRLTASVSLTAVLLGGFVAAGVWLPPSSRATWDTGPPVAIASPAASPVASPVPPRIVSATTTVTIRLTDGGFDPSIVQSTNGHGLTITLVNTGTRPHGFRIDAYQIGIRLDPGETATVNIPRLELGNYPILSDVPGDEWMQGSLLIFI